jgi:CHAT domain-containing protein
MSEAAQQVLAELLQRFLATKDEGERWWIASSRPELLSDDSQALLRAALDQAVALADESEERRLEYNLDLLEDCRQSGVAQAFIRRGISEGDFFNSSGNAHYGSFQETYEPSELSQALEFWQRAIDLTDNASPDWPIRNNNLGVGLWSRFRLTDSDEDLDSAISAWQIALSTTPDDSPHISLRRHKLAVALETRALRRGRLDELDDAVHLWSDPSAPATPDDVEGLNLLAKSLAYLSRLHGQVAGIERAVTIWRDLIESADEETRTPLQGNLASGLVDLYISQQRRDQRLLDEVVALLWPSFPDHAGLRSLRGGPANNLSNALTYRFGHSGEMRDVDGAVSAARHAVNSPGADPSDRAAMLATLGRALALRGRATGSVRIFSEAATCFADASAIALRTDPGMLLRFGPEWARSAASRYDYAEADRTWQYVLQAQDQLLRAQFDQRNKEPWLVQTRGLVTEAAYAAAMIGDPERAVLTLEQARGVLLAEALDVGPAALARLTKAGHSTKARQYTEAAHALRAASNPVERDLLRQSLDDATEQIRKVPGYENLLATPSLEDIYEAARESPLCYMLAAETGGLALVIRETGAMQKIPLPRLTSGTLVDQLSSYADAYNVWNNRDHATDEAYLLAQEVWGEELLALTEWAYNAVMAPLIDGLSTISNIVLIPTGFLALVPLHLAWRTDHSATTGRRYVLDDICVTYVPTARAAKAPALHADEVRSVLVVEDPTAGTPERLRAVARETRAIQEELTGVEILQGSEAEKTRVLAGLEAHDVGHFACHARSDAANPRRSGLALAGSDRLLLEDLERADLKTRLVVLSACETATIGTHLPDEVVGFPSAFVAAGADAVVGSMWSVPDVSTSLVMSAFYRYWGGGLHPAQALRSAQRDVRDMRIHVPGDDPERAIQPFADPIFWGAFAYTGRTG